MDDDAPNPWDRRDTETAKAYNAFVVYRALGSGRSLAQAALELYGGSGKDGAKAGRPKNLSTVEKWSSRHDWPARAAAWDAYQDKIAQAAFTAENARRAREMAAQAQEGADAAFLVFMELAATMKPHEAALAWRRFHDAERNARGMTTAVTETRHADADGNTLPTLTPEDEALRFARIADILRTIPPPPSAEDEGGPDADG